MVTFYSRWLFTVGDFLQMHGDFLPLWLFTDPPRSPPLLPTIAAQLLLDGVKIEPCTIIIMTLIYWAKTCLRGKTPPRFRLSQNRTHCSVGFVLKWRARSRKHAVNWAGNVVDERFIKSAVFYSLKQDSIISLQIGFYSEWFKKLCSIYVCTLLLARCCIASWGIDPMFNPSWGTG
jgi:hypothetical protein